MQSAFIFSLKNDPIFRTWSSLRKRQSDLLSSSAILDPRTERTVSKITRTDSGHTRLRSPGKRKS